MNLRSLGCLLAASTLMAVPAARAGTALEPAESQITLEVLASPDVLVQRFADWQTSRYREVLQAYSEALQASDGGAALAVAQCRFIEEFAYAEDLNWSEEAESDLDACRDTLEARFASDIEAVLYRLNGEYGEDAIAVGTPLLQESVEWTALQRSRLHAKLSGAFQHQEQPQQAGEHALLAAELDPSSELLPQAIRHLGTVRGKDAVLELVQRAPLAADAWEAGERIKALLDAGLSEPAMDEILRHREHGVEVAAKLLARAHLARGELDLAVAAIDLDGEPPRWENAEDRWLRFDIALAAGRFDVAGKVLGAARGHSNDFGTLMGNYARLLHATPAAAWQGDVFLVTVTALGIALTLLLAPALLLVPVHYRGLIRRLRGTSPTPLFARVGLRHAWIATATLLLVPTVVAGIVAPEGLGAMLGGGDQLSRHGDQLARQMLFGSAVCLILLAPMWAGLGTQALLGDGRRWKGAVAAAIVGWIALVALSALASAAGLQDGSAVTDQSRMIQAVATSLDAQLGAWAALGLLALLAPVLEELVFRGALLGGMSRHIGFGWANLMQALLFAAIHFDAPRFTFYLAMGLLCGWLTRRTGGLLAPIVLHALNNAVVVTAMVMAT